MSGIDTVRSELAEYEHPFFEFSAEPKGDDVEVFIRSKVSGVLSPVYRITVSDREIRHPQFRWTFQRLLYDCLMDYMAELFTRSPMTG